MDRTIGQIAFIHKDISGGTSLVRIARSAGLQAELYASIDAFLQVDDRAEFGCAVLHETQPNNTAFQMLRESKGAYGELLPVILLSTSDDADPRLRARDIGAAGFFKEPVDGEALLDAIRWLLCTLKMDPEDWPSESNRIRHDQGKSH